MIVTYRQLSEEARRITYVKYDVLCAGDPDFYRYESFEEYDDEQSSLDFSSISLHLNVSVKHLTFSPSTCVIIASSKKAQELICVFTFLHEKQR